MRIRIAMAALAAAAMAVAAGCGGSSGSRHRRHRRRRQLVEPADVDRPEGEGALNLIAWQGYTEPERREAVRGRRPAARSSVKYGQTSDEMVQLMRTGNYDGVSASGDATNRLIAAGDVVPINVQT